MVNCTGCTFENHILVEELACHCYAERKWSSYSISTSSSNRNIETFIVAFRFSVTTYAWQKYGKLKVSWIDCAKLLTDSPHTHISLLFYGMSWVTPENTHDWLFLHSWVPFSLALTIGMSGFLWWYPNLEHFYGSSGSAVISWNSDPHEYKWVCYDTNFFPLPCKIPWSSWLYSR